MRERDGLSEEFNEVMRKIVSSKNNKDVFVEKIPWNKNSVLKAINLTIGVVTFRIIEDKTGCFFPISIKLQNCEEEFCLQYGNEDGEYAGVLLSSGSVASTYKRLLIQVVN